MAWTIEAECAVVLLSHGAHLRFKACFVELEAAFKIAQIASFIIE